MIDRATSLADVAGAVAKALRSIGHDPVVVGGSAATVHAPEAYRSDDVDMVIVGGVDEPRSVVEAMATIGFRLSRGHFFEHPNTSYIVEFVPSPVAIAGDVIEDFATVRTTFGDLRVLRVDDVVADRLNKYVVYDDPDAFEVAVAVARVADISLDRVEAFVERQRAIGALAEKYGPPSSACGDASFGDPGNSRHTDSRRRFESSSGPRPARSKPKPLLARSMLFLTMRERRFILPSTESPFASHPQ